MMATQLEDSLSPSLASLLLLLCTLHVDVEGPEFCGVGGGDKRELFDPSFSLLLPPAPPDFEDVMVFSRPQEKLSTRASSLSGVGPHFKNPASFCTITPSVG